MRIPVIGMFLLLCISGTNAASAASMSWRALNPDQREALAPLDQQWDTLPEIQRKRLLETANRYPHLTQSKNSATTTAW